MPFENKDKMAEPQNDKMTKCLLCLTEKKQRMLQAPERLKSNHQHGLITYIYPLKRYKHHTLSADKPQP